VRCPEQISLVGFDRTQWTENAIPQLTTIAHPARQLAREAVRLLVESKGARPGAGPGADVTVLQAELCLRGSTAPPSVILEPERAAAR
jgi:DNA-binding LacI/PurR family transcriptional regulator